MRLKTTCAMTVNTPEACPVVAMLRPRSGLAQWMVSERYELMPWVRTTEYVDPYGNLCQRFKTPAGQMRIEVEVVMETEEFIVTATGAPATPVERLPDDALVFLLQSRYCPSDKIVDRAQQIVQGLLPGYDQVEGIRRWIHESSTRTIFGTQNVLPLRWGEGRGEGKRGAANRMSLLLPSLFAGFFRRSKLCQLGSHLHAHHQSARG